MPNLAYMLVSFAYHLALGLWIGGAVALGALTAPELFRQLPRPQAGGIFGPILRRFARLRLGAAVAAIAAAAAKQVLWETHAANVWILVRWVCLLFLAASVMYEILALEPAMAAERSAIAPDGGDDDPHRRRFMVFHRRSESLMKLSLGAAALAVFLG